MDFGGMMNNPMMGQLMQRLQSDPELMQLISQPDIMAKLQQIMQNPATAQQAMADDPQLQAVMQRLMGGGGGGGGGMGQMGGGIGGFGGGASNPWGSPTPGPTSFSSAPSAPGGASSSSSSSYIKIHSDQQYRTALKDAGSQLVVVDASAEWCRPCKMIYPVFAELASAYKGKAVFLKIDGDECRSLCQELGVTGFPTFLFFVKGVQVEKFSGADERRLRSTVAEYGDREDLKPCPYKHFPLKEAEQVKYAEMKWDVVESKIEEFNEKVGESEKLNDLEKAEVDVIIQTLQNKLHYQSSTFTDAQFKIMQKLLNWPLDFVGPSLNLMRVFVLHPHVAQVYSKQIIEEKRQTEGTPLALTFIRLLEFPLHSRPNVVSVLNRVVVSAEKTVTSMLALRVLCNFFSRRVLSKAMGARYEDVFDAAQQALKMHEDDNLRASAFALYINFTLLFIEDNQFYEAGKIQLLSFLLELLLLPNLSAKLSYRLLVILGTLLYEDSNTTEMAVALEVVEAVDAVRKAHSTDQQVQDASREVKQLLSSKS